MHNPEFALENETHKLLWDFEIQTDQLISTRRHDKGISQQKKKKKKKKDNWTLLSRLTTGKSEKKKANWSLSRCC